ncbi:hypothetical protein BDB00DRAFT_403236 [Zychaea mexicana]|uniref:uncharacterized protein n=1 Tax=Zychaea mexicana TaxID=64656 RepID=UPI0022FE5CA3|nr:uncharacterized protein BDB00DRAFT_403236 [Zychaea mexicana]KAI9498785.1 hypothetical protein BDB00DRAFT_403236 [Zychaea mexicana]
MYTRGARLTYSSARDDKLCMEIEELYRKSVPSRFVTDNRKKLIDKIVNILRRQYPRIKLRVEMFGSSATGLDFADSDLDLCILVPEQYFLSDIYDMNNKQRERNSYYNMWMLAGLLKRAGMVNIAAIPRANVPICKFEDPVLQLKADINTHNDMGLENSKLIKEYTFLEPRVRPFLYAIKTFTKMHKINDSSAGTLSSYTYVLMGLFFLMTCSPPVIPNLQCLNGDNACESVTCRSRTSIPKLSIYRGKPKQFDVSFHNCVKVIGADNCVPSQCQQNLLGSTPTYWRCHNTQNIGELLVDFFTFYGMVFDYERALSVRSGATIRKLPAWRKRCDLALEDPFITDRNVAISCSIEGFKLVLSEFERAAKLLKGGVDFAMVCRPAYDPTIYHDVQMADPYQSSPQHQQRYNNRQRQRQQQQEEHIMRQEQLAHVKDTYDHHEQNLNPVDNKAFSSSNSNKKAPSPLSYAPAAAISQEKKHNRDGLSIDHERTPSSNDSLPTIIPTYSPKFVKSEAEVNTKQQKHTIELDARNTEQSTPQDELSDTDFAFAPLSQQKSLPTAKHTRNNNKQKMHEPVISTHNIEPPQPEQVVPSRTNDVKQSNNSFPSVDDDDVDKYFTPPSTLFAESSRGSSTSRKPRASAKEDRLVGTLPSDDEEENDDNYHDDNDQDDQDDYVDGEEEERQQPFTHNDIKGDDVSTAASAATTSTTTVVDRETSALPLSSTMNPAAVVVKKATMRLSDMPYYVDKLDIIDALGACGFEVITIRSELVAQDELSLFPLKEWLVRVVGGRNQDLPAWFELQDMALVRSYETRRLVAYRNVIIKATLDL